MFNWRILCSILSLLLINEASGRPPQSTAFDILIFTQHWPQTVCYTWTESSSTHQCYLPKDHDEWTIHGLWPSQYHKKGPGFCNSSISFDPAPLKPIETELQEKWIDIEFGNTSTSLWEHEWTKHGTCAIVLPQLNSEFKYFKEGLSLLDEYDMKNVLAKANILPGGQYQVSDILNGIERVLGKRGLLNCRKNKKTGESYVFEIEVCFNKMMELIHCDDAYGYPTNCDKSASVTYPSKVPHYSAIQV